MEKGEKEMKYQTAYFCGYAKLPSALPTTTTNGSITLGLKIDLETACIEDVSVTFLSNLALSMCREYFIGKNILRDYDDWHRTGTLTHGRNMAP